MLVNIVDNISLSVVMRLHLGPWGPWFLFMGFVVFSWVFRALGFLYHPKGRVPGVSLQDGFPCNEHSLELSHAP